MDVTFQTCGNLYSSYVNTKLPWTELHAFSAKLATKPLSQAQVAPGAPGEGVSQKNVSAPQSRAKVYAYRAAVVPHHIMQIPDAFFGTGLHKQGAPIKITTGNEAVSHISECIRNPFDTGLIGLFQGLLFFKTVPNGAFLGALIGAACCASPKTIDNCAATGAMLFGILFWLPAALCLSAANGIFRAGTSLTKGAVVGAFYCAGYATGSLVDYLSAARVPAKL